MTELVLAKDPSRALQFNYSPREQFLPYHNRTQRYACIIAHRRAGKSYALLNDMIVRALTMRSDGLRQQFAMMAPTQTQARSIAWQYLRDQTACFAGAKGYKALEQHLTITLPDPINTNKPGSTIMLVGAENAERLRGLFLDGIVIDEAADVADFIISQIIRPALADRLGWLTVSGTVKSIDDYLWRTHLLAEKMPLMWYSDLLSADKTGIIPAHELEDLRRSMSEEAFNVEFLCDVNAAVTGKILLPYMNQKQITRVPYDPAGSPPVTAWDLGISDAMAVWTMQMVGREPHILDFKQESGVALDYFAEWLGKLPYARRLGAHLLPHDSRVRELGNGGKTRIQALRELGLRNLKIVPKLPKAQQIEAGRMFIQKCWFNEDTTEDGRKALRNYSFQFDPKRKVFSPSPLHDQYSNGADAFLALAVGIKRAMDAVEGAGPAGDIETETGAGLMGLALDDEDPITAPYEVDYEF